jgi:SPP1 family phage portal protein
MISEFTKIKLDNESFTGSQITKLVELHETNKKRFQSLNDYYMNNNEINNRTMGSGKPNNKLSHGFGKYITDIATSYFMGSGIRYFIENEEFDEIFRKVLDEEYEKNNNYELAKQSSIKGISYELMYIDENSNLNTKQLNSEDVIPIFSNKINEFLNSAIRLYTVTDYFEKDSFINYAVHYTKEEIITYKKTKNDKEYSEISREFHMLSDVPFILYLNNQELKGDFENVISQIDAYDVAQSDTANDFQYFTDAYLVLVGADGGFFNNDESSEAVKMLKEERILGLAEKGQAEWLIKEINDTAVENFKTRIYNNIFFLSSVPALTDESFGGNLSGVAIAYKLIGLENLASIKQNKFNASIKKKLKMITEFINLKYNKNFDINDIKIKFDRNVIKNLTEIIDNMSKLEGLISKETMLEQLPFIEDIKQELERITKEEKQSKGINKLDVNEEYE